MKITDIKEHKCIGVNCITNDHSLDFRISHGMLLDLGISPEEKIRINKIKQEMEKKNEKKINNIILHSFKVNII